MVSVNPAKLLIVVLVTLVFVTLILISESSKSQSYSGSYAIPGQGVAWRQIGQIHSCTINEVHWQGQKFIVVASLGYDNSAACEIIKQ